MNGVPEVESLAAVVAEMERSFVDQVGALGQLVDEAEEIEELLRNRQVHLTHVETLRERTRELKEAVGLQRQLLGDVRHQLARLREVRHQLALLRARVHIVRQD